MQLTPSSLLKHEKQDDGAVRVMLVAPNLYVGGPGGFFTLLTTVSLHTSLRNI